MDISKLLGTDKEQPSLHTDPFKKDCVKQVIFWINSSWNPPVHAQVEFKNGATEGKHTIKGDDFAVVVKQTQDFINSL